MSWRNFQKTAIVITFEFHFIENLKINKKNHTIFSTINVVDVVVVVANVVVVHEMNFTLSLKQFYLELTINE